MEYRIVNKERWEELKEILGEKACYVVSENGVMEIHSGDIHPDGCIRYDEILMIATQILDLLPYGKVVIDNQIYNRGKTDAVDLVLDVVLTALGKKW
jgi:hypothetical protein